MSPHDIVRRFVEHQRIRQTAVDQQMLARTATVTRLQSSTDAALPSAKLSRFVNSIGIRMLPIEKADTFLSAGFVTVAQFRQFLAATGYQTAAEESNLGGYVWTAPQPEQQADGLTVYIGRIARAEKNKLTLDLGANRPRQDFVIVDEAKVTLEDKSSDMSELAAAGALFARVSCRKAGQLKVAYMISASRLPTLDAANFVRRANACWHHPVDQRLARDADPVVQITREDAGKFCRWLSDREGETYRLPVVGESGTKSVAGLYEWFADDSNPSQLRGDASHSATAATPNHLLGFRIAIGDPSRS